MTGQTYEARVADEEARDGDGPPWWQEPWTEAEEADWFEAELAFERRMDQ